MAAETLYKTQKAQSDIGTKLYFAKLEGGQAPKTGFKWFLGVTATPSKERDEERLETTELHDLNKSYMKGRGDTPDLAYTIQHTEEKAKIAIETTKEPHAFLEVFSEGDGYLIVGETSYASTGLGLNGVHEATFKIIASHMEYLSSEEIKTMIEGSL